VPGENYSRYEFTGGCRIAGRKKYGGREMVWEGTADSGRVSELLDKARVVVGLNKLRNPSGEPA